MFAWGFCFVYDVCWFGRIAFELWGGWCIVLFLCGWFFVFAAGGLVGEVLVGVIVWLLGCFFYLLLLVCLFYCGADFNFTFGCGLKIGVGYLLTVLVC